LCTRKKKDKTLPDLDHNMIPAAQEKKKKNEERISRGKRERTHHQLQFARERDEWSFFVEQRTTV